MKVDYAWRDDTYFCDKNHHQAPTALKDDELLCGVEYEAPHSNRTWNERNFICNI